MIFGDSQSLQFFYFTANLKKYNYYIKYFYNWLMLVIQGLHLPEIEMIFYNFIPIWHSISDSNIQDVIEFLFKAAYNWINAKIVKKIQAYNWA